MGRRSHTRVLNAWMNGLLVGEWRILRDNLMEFQYDQSWLDNRETRRPLSLSLPLAVENVPLRGPWLWPGRARPIGTIACARCRHLVETARRCGYGERIDTTLHELVQHVPLAIAEVGRQLPEGFPMDVFETISGGLQQSARQIRDT